MSAARLLLLGPEAEALAARLEASGYALERNPEAPGAGPDLVLLGPQEQGRIAALRRRFVDVPILLAVEADSVEARVRCLSAGADDFWLPGQGTSDLLMRLRLQLNLRRRSGLPSPLLQVADLTLNPSSRQVKRGNRTVALTAREYQLLLLLLERQGGVVSRDQILRQVWNDDRGMASNVIEVYVRYLRQKLEQEGERRLIHTIRGQGYCLSAGLPALGGGG
ncbi:response regulator transcription factor [Cyanobium sp. ATX 6A2]|jgi:DNA-binding response OmpR family regulator|uniref:winged helix-turn-helix transcriptional regulator n=1 Tax=Cyanobium sp. ATX 6A2 TaxID=2823700 RepID=UPI0020CC5B54|nr:response regulator transcription factor [Cyanobium sp. ATX 6A2]MCP9888867.1 response regulator transcription factor [Cyanobium sp. ATX 6A2]